MANVHQQFIDGLPAPRYIMSIILSGYQNIATDNISNTLMCTLHNLSNNKARYRHTSTVTRLHSWFEKKYPYALRASCFYIEINILKHF